MTDVPTPATTTNDEPTTQDGTTQPVTVIYSTNTTTDTPPAHNTHSTSLPAPNPSDTMLRRRRSVGVQYAHKRTRLNDASAPSQVVSLNLDDSTTTAAQHDDDGDTNADENLCAICYEECVLPFKTECKHLFCFLCLKTVIFASSMLIGSSAAYTSSSSCPLCRTPISADFVSTNAMLDLDDYKDELTGEFVWKYAGRSSGYWLYQPAQYEEIEQAYVKFVQWQKKDRELQLKQLTAELERIVSEKQQQAGEAGQTTTTSLATTEGLDGDEDGADTNHVTTLSLSQELVSVQAAVPDVAAQPPQPHSVSTVPIDTTPGDVPTICSQPQDSSESNNNSVATHVSASAEESQGACTSPAATNAADGAPTPAESPLQSAAGQSSVIDAQPEGETTHPDQGEDEDDSYHSTDAEEDEDYDDHSHEDEYAGLSDEAKQRLEEYKSVRYLTLLIGGAEYTIDFVTMMQYPKGYPFRARKIIRQPKDEALDTSTKGVSGVTFVRSQESQN